MTALFRLDVPPGGAQLLVYHGGGVSFVTDSPPLPGSSHPLSGLHYIYTLASVWVGALPAFALSPTGHVMRGWPSRPQVSHKCANRHSTRRHVPVSLYAKQKPLTPLGCRLRCWVQGTGGCSVSVWIALKANSQSVTCHGIVAVAVAVVATAR